MAALDVPGARTLIPQVLPAAGPLQNLGVPVSACTTALDERAVLGAKKLIPLVSLVQVIDSPVSSQILNKRQRLWHAVSPA